MKAADTLKVLERCLDDAGRQVDSLNEIGNAANLRAVTVAAVYITCATAIMAGLIVLADKGAINTPLMLAGAVASMMYYACALTCLWSTLPAQVYIAGNRPDWWTHHLKPGTKFNYRDVLNNQVEEYLQKIPHNDRANLKANRTFKWGAVIGATTPLVAAVIYLAVLYLPALVC